MTEYARAKKKNGFHAGENTPENKKGNIHQEKIHQKTGNDLHEDTNNRLTIQNSRSELALISAIRLTLDVYC